MGLVPNSTTVDYSFLLFQQTANQSTILFLNKTYINTFQFQAMQMSAFFLPMFWKDKIVHVFPLIFKI